MRQSLRLTSILAVAALAGTFAFCPEAHDAVLTPAQRVLAIVRKLQPKLTDQGAKRLADAALSVSQSPGCNASWPILVSIAFNESSLRKDAIGIHPNGARDYGLMQINSKMALRLGLSLDRLLKDEHYAFEAGCRILTQNRAHYAKQYEHWLGLYRSGVAIWRPEIRRNAASYDQMVRALASRLGEPEAALRASN